jgi:hypothetical protein
MTRPYSAISIKGDKLAVSNGKETKSYDLSRLQQFLLHSEEYFHSDYYELKFAEESLVIAAEGVGASELYEYALNLPHADIASAKQFIRCPDRKTFSLWSSN